MNLRLSAAIAVLLLLFVASCAKIVPPDGGDQDFEAPRDTLMVPLNQSTYFNSKTIYIEFNEYVRLNDIYNELIVSPPLKYQPEIRIKKKGVLIQLKDTLYPDVTYTMNFGEGIVDVTEGNPAKGLLYAFSTGPMLDSLTVSGKVLDAYTGGAVEDAKVMLYQDDVDSLPRTERPYYFTTTNASGEYRFEYLKEGEYKLFALLESNRNYFFDDPTESIAFMDELVSPVTPSDTVRMPDLFMSMEVDTTQYLMAYDVDSTGLLKTKWFSDLNEVLLPEVELVGDTSFVTWVEGKDSLFLWKEPIKGTQQEWIFSYYEAADTLEGEVLDFAELKMNSKTVTSPNWDADSALIWRFDRPVASFDTSKISLVKDSIPMAVQAMAVADPFAVKFEADLVDAANYELELLPAAIESREGYKNDTLVWTFQTFEAEHYGKVKLNVTVPVEGEQYILEIYKSETVVERFQFNTSTSFTVERMQPGTFSARICTDSNGNGKWDPAFYARHIQPEKVYNLAESITVRSNWEIELDWDLNLE